MLGCGSCELAGFSQWGISSSTSECITMHYFHKPALSQLACKLAIFPLIAEVVTVMSSLPLSLSSAWLYKLNVLLQQCVLVNLKARPSNLLVQLLALVYKAQGIYKLQFESCQNTNLYISWFIASLNIKIFIFCLCRYRCHTTPLVSIPAQANSTVCPSPCPTRCLTLPSAHNPCLSPHSSQVGILTQNCLTFKPTKNNKHLIISTSKQMSQRKALFCDESVTNVHIKQESDSVVWNWQSSPLRALISSLFSTIFLHCIHLF